MKKEETDLRELLEDLRRLADPEKARILSSFFKTGKGQYGEGDRFLGIAVPDQRRTARKYAGLSLGELQTLLSSEIHEHRLTALLILVDRCRKADGRGRKEIVDFYLRNIRYVNSWDLVDLSAEKILGEYLDDCEKTILYELARSRNVWERRIAIMATFAFIRKVRFDDTLKLAELLLRDPHELIHKAVGWMLREVGKRDMAAEERFLMRFYRDMPRTMLRYAVERFEEKKRKRYLARV
ncbi:MAG: DNA alkylation repair protein [Chloroflexota bacterium]